ncbi:hypothetical protein A2U01_0067830, partial [Trifolium medium]|nr:hypothetical protein [Trifolium medium]
PPGVSRKRKRSNGGGKTRAPATRQAYSGDSTTAAGKMGGGDKRPVAGVRVWLAKKLNYI